MPEVVVRQRTPKVNVFTDIDVVNVIYKPLVITVYDDKPIQIPAIYIDGGTYDQEGNIIDAGFYNTTSWDNTWDAGYP